MGVYENEPPIVFRVATAVVIVKGEVSSYNSPFPEASTPSMATPKNVLGTELQTCSTDPLTGFYRDGCCRTGRDDLGIHTVCIQGDG